MRSALVAFVVVAAMSGVGLYGYVSARKRREALQRFAQSKGWSYRAVDDHYASRWAGAPFGEGVNRHARNVLVGTSNGFSMVAFDYSYETHSYDSDGDRDTTTHRYAVTVLAMPGYLPALSVTPHGALGRIGEALGAGDIGLESEAFNRRFRVTSPDRKLASDVLSPRTMELLLARSPLHWRITGTDIVCWESGAQTPLQILERCSTLAAVVSGVPGFVWQDHGSRPAASARPTFSLSASPVANPGSTPS